MNRLLTICAAILLCGCAPRGGEWTLRSPSGRNNVTVSLEDGRLSYRASRGGHETLLSSPLGLLIEDQEGELVFMEERRSSVDETWTPVWGKNTPVADRHNALILSFCAGGDTLRRLDVEFRAFDDGIALRYLVPQWAGADSLTVTGDRTTFTFPAGGVWWAHDGERANLGPLPTEDFRKASLTPLVVRSGRGTFTSVAEAAIGNMAYFTLAADTSVQGRVACRMPQSAVAVPFHTSWRVLFMTDDECALAASDLLVNLNPPCALDDTSWIRPGKSTWNWRVRGYVAPDGFVYDLGTEANLRLIDFAAANGFQYHVIDADWYGPEHEAASDPTFVNKYIDLPRIMRYAREKGVGIFLYLNDVGAKKYGLERILGMFESMGAAGVKYGFMKGEGQAKVQYTRKVVARCAAHRLMVLFHDHPVPPSGDERTWPNILGREYGHAQADAKLPLFPNTCVNQVFINGECGPLDMNHGWFDLHMAVKRDRVFDMVPSTVAAEMARMLVIFTGYNCVPDAPEAYLQKPEMFDLMRRIPGRFDSYRMLAGRMDGYASVARGAGSDWFVGTITNETARTIPVRLDFLDEGTQYTAHLYEDAEDTHYLYRRETFRTRRMQVRKGDVIRAAMAPGGGHCIYITPTEN